MCDGEVIHFLLETVTVADLLQHSYIGYRGVDII